MGELTTDDFDDVRSECLSLSCELFNNIGFDLKLEFWKLAEENLRNKFLKRKIL